MQRLLFIISSFLVCHVALFAQGDLEPLFRKWRDVTLTDSTRMEALRKIAWEGYTFNQPDSAYFYAQLLYDMAKAKGDRRFMGEAVIIQGITYMVRGNDRKALQSYQESLRIQEGIGYKLGMANSLNNIGGVHFREKNYAKATGYFERSMALAQEAGDKEAVARAVVNIAAVLSEQERYDDARAKYEEGMRLSSALGDDRSVAICLFNIAVDHFRKGDLQKTLGVLAQARERVEGSGDDGLLGGILSLRGDTENKLGQHAKAIVTCQQALELAAHLGNFELQSSTCECLYDAHKALGQGSIALTYHEQMRAFADSISAQKTGEELQRMEYAWQMEADSIAQAEKDRMVDRAHADEVSQKSNARNIAISVGLLLFLVVAALYARNRFIHAAKTRVEQDQHRTEHVLHNVLPSNIATELKATGRAEARSFDEVTVLFTDFKGFTEASEKLSPKDLVGELNTCFEAFDHIITARGIEKIKTIGDAYMCAGGLPDPKTSSPADVVHAALDMQAFMTSRKKERDAQGFPAFEMRVGIHTGPVVAGIVGVKKFQYDIWGDTVNTASRMESSGEVGEVNISEATYALVKDTVVSSQLSGARTTDNEQPTTAPVFSFTPRGKVQAKGKGEMEMYFVGHSS